MKLDISKYLPEYSLYGISYEADMLNPDLKINPWVGHRLIAYNLLKLLKPNLVLELGSHYGCSFFAFAQSIKDFKLTTKLIAVDTWEGDMHAGYYDSTVYNLFKKTVETYYSDIYIETYKMFFDDMLKNIKNESIDIIHIDGLHTYEATKHDFESWIPKLKKNGIMIFHDIANYTEYGSAVFWEELKQQYKHYFEVEHSWGLGILFPKGTEQYNKLIKKHFDLFLIYAELLGFKEQYYRDLQWQKKQTDKYWEISEKLKNDLQWQKKQTDKYWEISEKLKKCKS